MKYIDKLKEEYALFIADRANWLTFRITITMIIIVFFAMLFLWRRLPPELPLYYSLPWGKEQIVSPLALAGVLGLSTILFAINNFFAILTWRKNGFFSRIFSLGGTSIVVLTIITMIKIIFMVT